MSKSLSFRARALDASKPMPIYKSEEIPDLRDFAAINRAVPQMPTGMEKEEESEHHLQRALSAQQVYGTAEALVIPVPENSEESSTQYENLYKGTEFKPPKQYVHVQAFGMEQEIPDYDMDSEDEQWLNKQTKKMEITPLTFENMMDRLEKGSGQQVVTLPEAKLLLKEDDDLIIAVYDYWLNKRLRMQHPLIHTVKTEKRDGSTTNNPYVAFRRRTEKMQTRKNRKNDEASYEKMLKLRRDLNRALTILEMMKRREKSKKELLQLTIEIVDKRYQMGDFSGQCLAEAQAQRHTRPSYVPVHSNQYVNKEWGHKEESGYIRKKREYKRRKHKTQNHVQAPVRETSVHLPQYNEVDVLPHDMYSSEDDALSPPMSPSDHEDQDDPDGIYAFRRKANCSYLAPILDGHGNWPWCGSEEGGFAEKKYRYTLTSLTQPRRCIGFARRRVGRGGRILIDRAFTPWDDYLSDIDLTSSTSTPPPMSDLVTHIKENRLLHFRPRTPTMDPPSSLGECASPTSIPIATEFNVESFQNHQEQLLQMQRHQQEQLLKQETDLDSSFDLEHSFSSQPTSRFTLDSASAAFAASAVLNSTQELLQATHGANTTSSDTITNGPVDSKSGGFSTSPAATVLQLNYPLPGTQPTSGEPSSTTNSAAVTTASPAITTTVSSSAVSTTSVHNSTTMPALATKAVSPATPTILKLASTPNTNNGKNDTIRKDNHEETLTVKSLVKDQVVAMEVT